MIRRYWYLSVLFIMAAVAIVSFPHFHRVHGQQAGTMTLNGVPSQNISSAVGFAALYQASGTVYTFPKCTMAQATSTTGGAWSVSWTGVDFTTVPIVQVTAMSSAATAAAAYIPTLSSVSTSGASGAVLNGNAVSILGAFPLILSTTTTTVNVWACGT